MVCAVLALFSIEDITLLFLLYLFICTLHQHFVIRTFSTICNLPKMFICMSAQWTGTRRVGKCIPYTNVVGHSLSLSHCLIVNYMPRFNFAKNIKGANYVYLGFGLF